MTPDQIHHLRKSFARLEPYAKISALAFYRRLFELEPGLRPLFTTDIEVQAEKLMNMLRVAVNLTEQPASLESELRELGARHRTYGTRDEHYGVVGQALLEMFASVLGDEFTPAVRSAWTCFYDYVAATMKQGAADAGAKEGDSVDAEVHR